ncbi:uncharacterized protein LOC122078483 [Macadamia integrifolia]|uniref:uncharacterized protein LOC122078483 n=1 Tax=Macadamia integrifolia TaxID=60698 RepID=UPI001C4FD1E8|nr:uncharacterized protein LOC122078483 [Macadamia integrifolia]XP_042500417.1 uncharacterized protein LOC122078483 [Macadamia integrifolia]
MEEVNGEELLNEETAPPVKAGKNCGSQRLPEIDMENLREEETLYGVLRRFFAVIFFTDRNSSSLLERTKASVSQNAPLLREGFKNTSRDLLLWSRRGSPLRALLVVSVGTIILLALTGLLVFMLFFLAATINAVIISLVISLAAAGGFLAIFFASVTTIYIGALSVAAFAISTATVSTIIAVVIATGWIGFFWALWLATLKSLGVAKHSLNMTGSALLVYSAARQAHHHNEADKVD